MLMKSVFNLYTFEKRWKKWNHKSNFGILRRAFVAIEDSIQMSLNQHLGMSCYGANWAVST